MKHYIEPPVHPVLRGEIVFPGQTETGISGKIRNIVAAGSFVLVGV